MIGKQLTSHQPPATTHLLLLVDVHELGVNNIVLGFRFAGSISIGATWCGTTLRRRATRLAGGFVHGLGQFVAGRFQLGSGLVDAFDAALGHRFLGLGERVLHGLGVVGADFVAMLL